MSSSAIYSSDSFTRGSAKVVNCYEADIEGVEQNKQQHYNPTAADRKTITLPLEEVANGTLCYNLNGKQFRDPSWYQTIEDDAHPYPFGDHAIVLPSQEHRRCRHYPAEGFRKRKTAQGNGRHSEEGSRNVEESQPAQPQTS